MSLVILENVKMFPKKRQTSRFTVAKSVIIQEHKKIKYTAQHLLLDMQNSRQYMETLSKNLRNVN